MPSRQDFTFPKAHASAMKRQLWTILVLRIFYINIGLSVQKTSDHSINSFTENR
jgi:hypothetical protein